MSSIGPSAQLEVWGQRALDARASLRTGFPSIDEKLYRGGLQAGTFIILAGRTHMRKTTVALNLCANFLAQGKAVGWVGLDEPIPLYVAKLCSVLTGRGEEAYDAEWLEEHWHEVESKNARELYMERTEKLSIYTSARPSFGALTAWVEETAAMDAAKPEVVIIDYMSLLARGQYAGKDVTRVPQLAEELKVWAREQDIIVVALHQVGRQDDGKGKRTHGDLPMALESLKYGGEEMADIVFGMYRPAMNYLASLTPEEAQADLGKDFSQEAYDLAANRAQRYRRSTFLQLLKNRPSHKGLDYRGVELIATSSGMELHQCDPDVDLDEQDQAWEKERARAGE